MDRFKRAMVALDLSKMDETLIKYTHFISKILNFEKIYFIHIIPDLVYPDNINLEFHKLFAVDSPVDERVKTMLKKKVDAEFSKSEHNIELVVEVVEGSPYQKLIHWAEVKEVNLLITGRKNKSLGSGITSRRVAHKADCSVLFVPENFSLELNRIMVPVDFSENSARALQLAVSFKSVFPELEIMGVHLIRLLSMDYYYGLDKNPGYRKAFLDSAKKSFGDLLEKHELPADLIQPVYLEDDYGNVSRHLCEYLDRENLDLVIMGARGHTTFQNFLYGSVTERFVELCGEIPILVVR